MIAKAKISDAAHIWAVKVGMQVALIGTISLEIRENFFNQEIKPLGSNIHHTITNYRCYLFGGHFAVTVSKVLTIGSTWRALSYMTQIKPLKR